MTFDGAETTPVANVSLATVSIAGIRHYQPTLASCKRCCRPLNLVKSFHGLKLSAYVQTVASDTNNIALLVIPGVLFRTYTDFHRKTTDLFYRKLTRQLVASRAKACPQRCYRQTFNVKKVSNCTYFHLFIKLPNVAHMLCSNDVEIFPTFRLQSVLANQAFILSLTILSAFIWGAGAEIIHMINKYN